MRYHLPIIRHDSSYEAHYFRSSSGALPVLASRRSGASTSRALPSRTNRVGGDARHASGTEEWGRRPFKPRQRPAKAALGHRNRPGHPRRFHMQGTPRATKREGERKSQARGDMPPTSCPCQAPLNMARIPSLYRFFGGLTRGGGFRGKGQGRDGMKVISSFFALLVDFLERCLRGDYVPLPLERGEGVVGLDSGKGEDTLSRPLPRGGPTPPAQFPP